MNASEMMAAQLARLRDEVQQAQSEIAATWSASSGTKESILTSLSIIRTQVIDGSLVRMRAQVEAGTRSYESWAALAEETHDTIASYYGDIGSWSFKGAIADTLKETAQTVKEGALTAAAFGLPVVALVALAVIAVTVIPRVSK